MNNIVHFLCPNKENEPKENCPAREKFFNAGIKNKIIREYYKAVKM